MSSATQKTRGFTLRLPFAVAPIQLGVEHAGHTEFIALQQFSRLRLGAARLLLLARFGATLCLAASDIWQWKIKGEEGARTRVKDRLGFITTSEASPIVDDLFSPDTKANAQTGATIILPVYNAFDILPECLDRVLAHTEQPFRLIVIEDCSTDARVRPFLEQRIDDARNAGHDVLLVTHAQNQGFIGAVNTGLEHAMAAEEHPVVLLNSDAMVPQGWLGRLIAPLLANPQIASVTPFSNDAEIFSVPAICQRTPLVPGQVDKLDANAQRIAARVGSVDCPTGVGFCMALSPRFLRQIGGFDPIFGRGYGEETDWCQRARAIGGRHVCAVNLFVEHRGVASFGTKEKRQLLDRNHGTILKRYPEYDIDVQNFLRDDPLSSARLAHAIAWAGIQNEGATPLYLAHAMGGGAENYLQARFKQDLELAKVRRPEQSVRRCQLHPSL